MINEKQLRPIEIALAAKLCLAGGQYRWRYLRAAALERIGKSESDECEYVSEYRRFLRMARTAVKFMEGTK
jgi:hypothetical protein